MAKKVFYDCASTEPLRASGAHYMYHRRRGQEQCRRALDELNLAGAGNPGKAKEWLVYVVKFADGQWYYGSTSYHLWKRHHKSTQAAPLRSLLDGGVDFTSEVLARCDTKEQALKMEARCILASDRSRLVNTSTPWHFCDIYTEGSGAYQWHYDRGEDACDNALKARRDAYALSRP